MKETIYIKKYIKTVDDLPKVEDEYYVHTPEDGLTVFNWYGANFSNDWLNIVDWYLQEVELPSDEEIEKKAEYYATEEGGEDITPMVQQPDLIAFYDGAKWIINKLLNK